MPKWKKIRRKKQRRKKNQRPGLVPTKKQQPQKSKQQFAWKGVTQPKWKWSYDNDLLIWAVDPVYGQPHHIEVTGPGFFRLAQGRVYVEKDGHTEIMVWADRGTKDKQDEAVDAVAAWLQARGRSHDVVTYEREGFNWMSLGDGQMPTDEQIKEFYYYQPATTITPGQESLVYEPGTPGFQEGLVSDDYWKMKPHMFGDESTYGDDPNMVPGAPEQEWDNKIERYWELAEKPIHSLTDAEWRELEQLVDGDWSNLTEIWEAREWDAGSLEHNKSSISTSTLYND